MRLASETRGIPVRDRDRGQLFHPLDARYTRVMTADLDKVIHDLCREIDAADIDCVLGLPEGGVAGAYSAAQALARPLVLSTRMPHLMPGAITFEEPHNADFNGRTHYVYALGRGDRVLLVEDEITSGRTIINAIRALKAAGVEINDILVLMVPENAELLASIESEGVRIHAHEVVPRAVSEALVANRPG